MEQNAISCHWRLQANFAQGKVHLERYKDEAGDEGVHINARHY